MSTEMTFDVEIYVGKEWDAGNKIKCNVEIEKDGTFIPVKTRRLHSITERVSQMSNAWVVNEWIADNCTETGDTNWKVYIDDDQAMLFLEALEEVISNPELAEELLPIPSFFEEYYDGEYNGEYYRGEIEEAYKIMKEIVEDIKDRGVELYFSAY